MQRLRLWPKRSTVPLLGLFWQHGVQIELADADLGTFGENHRLHDAILELTDIPRPMVFLHQHPRCRREAQGALLILKCEMLQKVLCKKEDVIRALAQRRDGNPHDVQAMVEVFSKSSCCGLDRELAIRDRDESCVDAQHPSASHGCDLTLLDEAKQLALNFEGKLADLIEDNRAAFGFQEAPDPALLRSRISTSLVSEQLALDQGRRDGAAVDDDEWLFVEGTQLVHGPRDDLFAGAAFSDDENGRLGRRHTSHGIDDGFHLWRFVDELGFLQRRSKIIHLGSQPRLLLFALLLL